MEAEELVPVSYTHLDVYKRQIYIISHSISVPDKNPYLL